MGKVYQQLSLSERRKIYFWREEKKSVDEISALLGRHRSTIYRELQRNYFSDDDPFCSGYFHLNAVPPAPSEKAEICSRSED